MTDPLAIVEARAVPITEAVGLYGADLRRCGAEMVGPCPVCGGSDRFAVHLRRNIWNCRGCGRGGDAIDLVRHVEGIGFQDAVDHLLGDIGMSRTRDDGDARRRREEADAAEAADRARKIRKAGRIWAEAVDPRGTIVETYLASRGLELPAEVAGTTLRFHGKCPWETGTRPAMVAAMRSVITGDLRGAHRTALDGSGRKLGRKMLGLSGGCAVMLDKPGSGALAVAEGIESALSARQLGLGSTWALGSVGEIERLPVLAGVERLTLCEENDESGASMKAVGECGRRWEAAGRIVTVIRPRAGCSDLNDVLRSSR